MAIILGVRSGLADARAGHRPYFSGLLFETDRRRDLFESGFHGIIDLVLVGILLDAVFQWVILGTSHPGAALVVGPVLIALPYALSRDLSNRARGKGRVS
jgi:hypothetical protein